MRKFWIILSVCWLWTCGGGSSSPTEPEPPKLPTVTNLDLETAEDTSLNFTLQGTEPSGLNLTYAFSSTPSNGQVTLNGAQATYNPNANYNGTDTFGYIATSASGSSTIGTISITITPVDDEPNSMDVSATTDEDNAVTITLEAEEYDGDNIVFQVRNNPSNGSVTISGNTATYTPNENFNGTDTFNFEAVDSNARSVLNVATATITVNPVNDAPTVVDVDAGEVERNQSLEITLQGSDVDNDTLTYSIVDQPSNGTVSINGSIATYNATSGGEDSFTYQASDGTETSNEATISIIVKVGWSKTYGGTGGDVVYSILQTSDGGYLLAGRTNSFGSGDYDMYLVKTDANGSEEWSQTFGGAYSDYANSVIQTFDGGYLLVGRTSSFGNGSSDMYLVKTDANGSEEWSKTCGGEGFDWAQSVIQTSDGGYLLGGYTQSFGNGSSDMYLVKTDANGSEEWSKTFGGKVDDKIYSILQTSDGGYLLGGYTLSFGNGNNDMYLVKTDASGNEEWSKTFGGENNDYVNSVLQTSDGGYLLGGMTYSFGNGDGDMYLVKTDVSGNEEWSKTFGGTNRDYNWSTHQTSDGGYILGGHSDSFGNGEYDMHLVKTDASGNEEWSKTFGGTNRELLWSILQTSDGGYLLGGYTDSFGNGNGDMYLVKTDSEGNQ